MRRSTLIRLGIAVGLISLATPMGWSSVDRWGRLISKKTTGLPSRSRELLRWRFELSQLDRRGTRAQFFAGVTAGVGFARGARNSRPPTIARSRLLRASTCVGSTEKTNAICRPSAPGHQVINPLHWGRSQFVLFVLPLDRSDHHHPHHEESVLQFKLFRLNDFLKVLAERPFDVGLKMFLRNVLSGFCVREFLDIALGDESFFIEQAEQRLRPTSAGRGASAGRSRIACSRRAEIRTSKGGWPRWARAEYRSGPGR